VRRLTGILVKTGVALLVVVALLVSVFRLTFPYLNDFRQPLLNQIQAVTGVPLTIEHLEGEWLSFGPSLRITNLQIHSDKYDLDVDRITLELDVWRSLVNFRWQFRDLTFYQLQLIMKGKSDKESSEINKANIEPGSLGDIFLRQINYFDLKNSSVYFLSPSGAPVELRIPQLTWLNKRARHQAEGEVSVSGLDVNHGRLKVILDLTDDKSGLLNNGMIYLQADDVNMKPWLSQWVRNNTGLNNANFSLDSWIRIDNRQIAEGRVKLYNGKVNWSTTNREHHLDIDEQWLHLTKQNNGWQLDLPQLNVRSDGNQWPDGALSLFWQPQNDDRRQNAANAEQLRIRATDLKLDYLRPILPIFTFLDPERLAPWLELNPQGNLSALALDIPLKQPEQIKFIAQWQDVSWLPWRKLPGVDHFSGYAEGNLSRGLINVSLQNSVLPYQQVFRAPLEIEKASGQLFWTHQGEQWKLWSNGVDVQARSLWINGDFGFSTSPEQGPWVSILAGIDLYDGKDAWRYYPEPLMGKNLVDYLTEAIQGGKAKDATLIFEGNPQHFPFKQKTGKFEVFVPLREATLKFQPTWKPLTDITINLDFIDNGLWMRAKDARLMNVQMPEIIGSIPAYNEHTLYLEADIYATGDHVYDYLKESPLRHSVAAALEQIQITGDVSGHLRLSIPLTAGDMVAADGNIRLDGNDVLVKPVNIQLNKVKGDFAFTNDTLTGKGLKAYWFEQPIDLNFDTQKNASDYKINVGIRGNWALAKLPMLPTTVAQDLTGIANWQSDVAITLPTKGVSRYAISLKSRITSVSERLSGLLGGKKGQPVSLELQAKGDTKQFNLTGAIGQNYLNTQWVLADKHVGVKKGVWQTNAKKAPELPSKNALILNLPEINGDYWLPLLTTQASNQAAAKTSSTAFVAPNEIELKSPALSFAGQRWRDISVKVDKKASGADIKIDSQELSASVSAPDDHPWRVNIERLYYNPVWPETSKVGGSSTPTRARVANKSKTPMRDMPISSFRRWPSLLIRCGDCWFMGQSFGLMEATLQPSANTLKLTHGLIDTGNTKLSITGEWQSGQREVSTAFKGRLSGSHFDQSMRHFGIITPVKNAPYTLDFDLSWRGEPWKPQIETLSGKLASEMGQGQVANLGGGAAGQIMRFVSVTALLRKLQYDFSDSFGDGFDFDSVKASSSIRNGVIMTDSLLIDGASADIAMRGSVDLVQQRINMEAVVAPELSAAVGVATAFAINPVAGVAVYAASKALAPLWSKISFIRYQITGSLDNPDVSEVLRQANKEN
jgi:uncharacterized protein (TIGR02099 family)